MPVPSGVLADPADGVEDCVWGAVEQHIRVGLSAGDVVGAGDDAGIEQQPGTTGLGAETPAMSEPSPSFCSVGASSFPLASIPLADWNFSTAATVFESHLPFGSPW